MMIHNLLYEESVLLQNIMWYVQNHTDFVSTLDLDNQEIFDELYNKIMES